MLGVVFLLTLTQSFGLLCVCVNVQCIHMYLHMYKTLNNTHRVFCVMRYTTAHCFGMSGHKHNTERHIMGRTTVCRCVETVVCACIPACVSTNPCIIHTPIYRTGK